MIVDIMIDLTQSCSELQIASMEKNTEKDVHSCIKCGSVCCKHVALEIDKPRSKQDFDFIRWYLLHENIEVFTEDDGTWYLKFQTPCRKLLPDGRCGYYEKRPSICRDYPPKDRECEFDGDDPYFKDRFLTAEDLDSFLKKREKNRSKARAAKKISRKAVR